MFHTQETDFLAEKIRSGEAIIFLGAGASHGCKNSHGKPVFKGKDLEAEFRRILVEDGQDLDLGDLAEDLLKQEGDLGFVRHLEEHFLDCTPSHDLKRLFKYTWFRCYTLNFDDCITKIPRYERAQKIKQFSRNSSVEEQRDFTTLQVIYLNGSILQPTNGFILSPKQYRSELRQTSTWYKKCAHDFADRIFIFIGTELEEPVFQAHIEALQEGSSTAFSKSFLVSPTKPSDRRIGKLKDYNIHFEQGSIGDFVDWLDSKFGGGNSPEAVIQTQGLFSAKSDSDIEIASSLIEIGTPDWIESRRVDPTTRRRLGRDFYSGIAPTWETVANEIPTRVDCVTSVSKFLLDRANVTKGEILLVRGQSGSGKKTATMQGLIDVARSKRARVFEISDSESTTLTRAIEYLGTQAGKKKLLYIPSIHLHIDFLDRISLACERSGVDVVGQIRNSDWTGRLGRRRGFVGATHEMSRLSNTDYALLSKSLDEHAVAPEFRKLDQIEKIALLKKSNRQLLILMMEATKQRAFEEIIEDEFNSINDSDAKAVFCIVALITMARSRLSVGEIEDIVNGYGTRKTFAEVLEMLDGMVEITSGRLLVGRHDLFVRHIVEKTVDHTILKDVVVAILNSFTIYKEPFVKNAGKVKGNILKFLMRARFLQEIFGKSSFDIVADIYDELEHSYQRDGHFWLQRGKFYQARGLHEQALKYLYRSVEAYDNEFSRHSLAHQKLIYCSDFARSSHHLHRLLLEGVEELERQIDVRDDAEDEYPIVALSTLHPEVLFRWGQVDDAINKAKEYFERLKVFEKRLSYKDKSVIDAQAFCLHLVTQGSLPARVRKGRGDRILS